MYLEGTLSSFMPYFHNSRSFCFALVRVPWTWGGFFLTFLSCSQPLVGHGHALSESPVNLDGGLRCMLLGDLSFPALPPTFSGRLFCTVIVLYMLGWEGFSVFLPFLQILVDHRPSPSEDSEWLKGLSLSSLALHSVSSCIKLVRMSQERIGRWAWINMWLNHLGIWVPHASLHMATKSLLAILLVSPFLTLYGNNTLVLLGWKQP